MGFIEFASYVLVRICNPFFTRNDKDDNICFFHGNFCLVFDLLHEGSINIVNPSSINHTERTVEPLTRCIDTVTCHTLDIFYD